MSNLPNDPVQELEIRNLIARAARAADIATDEQIESLYLDCFTNDAIWESRIAILPNGVSSVIRQGHEELKAAARERRDSGLQGPGANSMHLVMTSVVRIDGLHATAQSSFMLLGHLDERPTILAAGLYDDALRRADDGWRLAHRILSQP